MKKLFYLFAILLASSGLNAADGESLWTNENGPTSAQFNSLNGANPFGWFRSTSGDGHTFTWELTEDRDGNLNEALKISRRGSATTWHEQLKTTSLAANSSDVDYNPLVITSGEAFYFTFWAKASVAGTKLYVGSEGALGGWGNLPEFVLTTEWKQYGMVMTADKVTANGNQFNIHLRTEADYYLDDLVIKSGSDMVLEGDEGGDYGDGFIWQNANGPKSAEFNTMNGTSPFGWYRSASGDGHAFTSELTEDRNGNANEALKIIRTGDATTWHEQLRTTSLSGNSAAFDYNPLIITSGEAFYFTFWAKASVAGTKLYVGSEGALGGWGNLPEFELTTEWAQYSMNVTADKVTANGNQLNIHFRTEADYYLDDLVIKPGAGVPMGIGEKTAENNSIRIMQSGNGISFTCSGGLLEIYDVAGKIICKQNVEAGITHVPAGKGLYIVRLTNEGQISTVKTIIK